LCHDRPDPKTILVASAGGVIGFCGVVGCGLFGEVLVMAEQRKQRKCKMCEKKVLATRPGTSHLLHLFLSVITAGIWIPVWVLISAKIGGWRCPNCGSKC
jgi:hypothetical protein